jgi:hypothetical protein
MLHKIPRSGLAASVVALALGKLADHGELIAEIAVEGFEDVGSSQRLRYGF